METEVKIYNIKKFVRKNVSGELDLDKSMEIARDFAIITYSHSDHNVLIDMRDTTLLNVVITDLLQISLEIAKHLPDFNNKIACVVPDNEKRLQIATQFRSCMHLKGFSYELFTDFERALEWLSETSGPYKIKSSTDD